MGVDPDRGPRREGDPAQGVAPLDAVGIGVELGVEPAALFEPENEQALTTIASRLVDRVERYEARARLGVGRLPFRSRLAVLSALRIYGAIGRRVAELGGAAWDQRVTIGKAQKLAFVVPSFAEAVAAGRR